MKKIILVLVMGLVSAYAHSGGTNSAGCHTNHKTGEYHCHRSETHKIESSITVEKDKAQEGSIKSKEEVKAHSHS